ncbi:flippase-like domain-containing protein [Pseudonocardia sp. KRD-184]|uniref:Flippase-like domain-containing protein n=1 Tax=Pseudonocardia oceani TaxID=2792013 RepID=A0ABS6U675_9PSEU|nr:lysylphosphatidylglycerol synthase transmembrane domain-containing protein [Pseudonocardia oceani]MBW0089010.1 flippase-like domain-containing protein [Pseudonocardia oceani]MBW0094893.1 flippase-like domain-containing protein [Pseudonocardia oceani]MBW0108690.1 flippase-like domain-containing protein [Pseudonocardia oceani]MBW0120788.1 flippase-like domain-containing protein [Pseudonocardia oceani]MBW0127669.1 flippase-like domain-containing protein [Pseudonocardia oceani]
MKTLAGAAVLVALAVWVGTDAVVDGLAAIDAAAVLVALAVGLLTTLCAAGRWCLVARGLGVALPFGTAVADTYRASFLNSVLPAGVLGDVHRAVRHGRDDGRGLRAVVLERTAGQVVVVVAGLAVLLARPVLLGGLLPALGAGLALLGTVALVAWRVPRVRALLGAAASDVRVLARRTGPAVVALSLTALAGYLALFVVAARAAGATAPVGELLPLLVLSLLAMVLPLTVGGWGPREAVGAVAFSAAGLGAAQGLTAAVVYGVLGMIACLPGLGVVLLARAPRRAVVPEPVPC